MSSRVLLFSLCLPQWKENQCTICFLASFPDSLIKRVQSSGKSDGTFLFTERFSNAEHSFGKWDGTFLITERFSTTCPVSLCFSERCVLFHLAQKKTLWVYMVVEPLNSMVISGWINCKSRSRESNIPEGLNITVAHSALVSLSPSGILFAVPHTISSGAYSCPRPLLFFSKCAIGNVIGWPLV